LASERFNEATTIDLGHSYGDSITIRGVEDVFFRPVFGSPIVGVSGVNIPALSAQIQLSTSSDLPNVGDYVNIYATSGREVAYQNYFYLVDTTSGSNSIQYRLIVNLQFEDTAAYEEATNSPLIPITPVGHKHLLTYFTSNNIVSQVRTVSAYFTAGSPGGKRNSVAYFENSGASNNLPTGDNSYLAAKNLIVQVGNPESFRNTTFTQTPLGSESKGILTFADGVATNTWLNPGDAIYALGQVSIVESVASNNTCVIDAAFKFKTSGAITDTIAVATPFLVKTFHERYRGLHRVVNVDAPSRRVILEILNYGYTTNSMAPYSHSYALNPISGFPLPFYGISNIGNQFNITRDPKYRPPVISNPSAPVATYPQAKIIKTKLNFDNAVSALYPVLSTGFACMSINGSTIKAVDNLVIENDGPLKSFGLAAGYGGTQLEGSTQTSGASGVSDTQVSSVITTRPASLTFGISGVGIYGKFLNHIANFDSFLAGSNIGCTGIDRNVNSRIEYFGSTANCNITYNSNGTGTLLYTALNGLYSTMQVYGANHITSNAYSFVFATNNTEQGSISNFIGISRHSGYRTSGIYNLRASRGQLWNTNRGFNQFYGGQFYGTGQLSQVDFYHGFGILHTQFSVPNGTLYLSVHNVKGTFYPTTSGFINFSGGIMIGGTSIYAYMGGAFTIPSTGGDFAHQKFVLMDYVFGGLGTGHTIRAQDQLSILACNYIVNVAGLGTSNLVNLGGGYYRNTTVANGAMTSGRTIATDNVWFPPAAI